MLKNTTLSRAAFATSITALLLSGTARAQAGSLDATFASAGTYIQDLGAQDNLTKVRIQPGDQKIVAVGTALTSAFAGQLLVIRLNPDGTPDTGFDGDGSVVIAAFTDSYAYDLFFHPDGKIVVVGSRADASYQFSMLALRLNTDGSLDTGFGTGGYATPEISTGDDFAYAVAPLPGGQMLLAGTALDAQFHNQPVVVRMNNDGSIDNTFGTGGVASISVSENDNKFWNVGLQPDGSIIASGHLDQGVTGTGQVDQDILVARFTSNGALDASFGTNGTVVRAISVEYIESAFSMAIGTAGELYLAGYTTLPDFSFDAFLLKLDADGNDGTGFGTNGLVTFDNADQDVATGVLLQPDGKILICGTSGGFFFDPRDQLLLRYLPNGTLDTGFDGDGYALTNALGNFEEANALVLQADGKIVVAGKASNGSNNDITVYRHLNDLDVSVAERPGADPIALFPNPVEDGGTVRLDGLAANEAVQVRLIDARGAVVFSGMLHQPSAGFTVPQHVAPGLYSLQITGTARAMASARLVVR